MCLIHIRPARDPSPDPMVVPSRPITRGTLTTTTIPAPPLSPHAYHSPRASRPRHSQTQIPRPQTSPRVSGPLGEPLKRLSIHSREQFEAQQLKQLEREREASAPSQPPALQYEQQRQRQPQLQPQTHSNPPPPSAPEPPSPLPPRPSYDRPRPSATPTTRSPHTSISRLPPLRRGSDYTYGSTPIPALSNGSLVTTPPPPTSPASKDKENIPLANMAPKAGHRRRESGVSVVNGKDGSCVERERPRLGGGGNRSSSLSVGGGGG